MTLHSLSEAARLLPRQEREQLLSDLLSSLAAEPLTDVEVSWLEEAHSRRDAQRHSGEPLLEPERVFADVRSALRAKR